MQESVGEFDVNSDRHACSIHPGGLYDRDTDTTQKQEMNEAALTEQH